MRSILVITCTVKLGVLASPPPPPLCTTLILKWAFAPNFTEFVVINAHRGVQCTCSMHMFNAHVQCTCSMHMFNAHVAHNLDTKTVKLSATRMGPGRWGFTQVKKQHFLSVSAANMANNQLSPCTFSTTECLQWWAFTPGTRHPSQDFGPKMGLGVCPKVGLYPGLYGRCVKQGCG